MPNRCELPQKQETGSGNFQEASLPETSGVTGPSSSCRFGVCPVLFNAVRPQRPSQPRLQWPRPRFSKCPIPASFHCQVFPNRTKPHNFPHWTLPVARQGVLGQVQLLSSLGKKSSSHLLSAEPPSSSSATAHPAPHSDSKLGPVGC